MSGFLPVLTMPHPNGIDSPGRSPEELDLRLADEEEVPRCRRNRPVDRKHGDLEPVAGRHGAVGQHDAVGHVEALDRPWARPTGGARHRAVDPDFRVVVDVDAEHRHLGRPSGGTASQPDLWANLPEVVALARYPNVAMKATGAPSYSGHAYPFADIHDNLHLKGRNLELVMGRAVCDWLGWKR